MKTILASAVTSVLVIASAAGSWVWLGAGPTSDGGAGRDLRRSATPEVLAVASALELDQVERHPVRQQPAVPQTEKASEAVPPAPMEPAVEEPAVAPDPEPTPVEVMPTPDPEPTPAPVEVAAVPASSGAGTALEPGQTVTLLASPMSGGGGDRGEAEMPAPSRREGVTKGGGACPHGGRGGRGGRGGGGVIGVLW